MRIDGQCHCGQCSYEADVDPDEVSICHCMDCQVLTGSAFRVTVFAARESIRQIGHAPRIYVKTAENGQKRLQYFCGDCGSPLFTTGEGEAAARWGIRWGSIRQRDLLVPRRQEWCRSAPGWVVGIDRLPGSPAG